MEQQRLRELENRCIQEENPWCTAACPLHVDARSLCAHIARGDFERAWTVLLRQMPVPSILGRICDHPCETRCRRGEAGGSIRIGALEQSVVNRPEPRIRRLPMPGRPGRIRVAGSGLSSLTVACDLAGKGYAVEVLTPAGRIGGSLLDMESSLLPTQAIAAEKARLERLGVVFRLGETVPGFPLEALPVGMDVLYFGCDDPVLADAIRKISVDPFTGETWIAGVFAGGVEETGSPVELAASGRRAAVSMDRYMQKVSLRAGRGGEGPMATRLYTRLQGIEAQPAVPVKAPEGYDEGEAVREAARCLHCECLECVRACPYLASFGAYPRVYARQIYNNEAIVKGQHTANLLVNSCMLCDLCTAVCPEDFPMAELCLQARESMAARGKMPPSAHGFALEDMAFSNGECCRLIRSEPGKDACRFLFYPGCQLAGSSPAHVAAVYEDLRAHCEGGVGLALGCCGAPARWAGREELFRETMVSFSDRWEELGRPVIVAACSSCLRMFRDALPGAEVRSLWEVLDKTCPIRGIPERSEARLLHDPCTTRHEPGVREAVRRMLGANDIPFREYDRYGAGLTKCCGFGGLLSNVDRDLADRVAADRIADGEGEILTYCAMCRDRLTRTGGRVLHLLDLLYPGTAGDDPAGRRDPGFSVRQENRRRLKEDMLTTLWKEKPMVRESSDGIRLVMDDTVRELIERRRILVRDLQAVIDHAERTGRRLVDEKTGYLLASHRPGSVTFWVEYIPAGGAYMVRNAYSHRMAVKGQGE